MELVEQAVVFDDGSRIVCHSVSVEGIVNDFDIDNSFREEINFVLKDEFPLIISDFHLVNKSI